MSPDVLKGLSVEAIMARVRRAGGKIGERVVEIKAPGCKVYGALDALVQKGYMVFVDGHVYAPRF